MNGGARIARLTAAVVTLGIVLPACSASPASSPKTVQGRSSIAPVDVATGGDHECVVPGSPPPRVAWSELENPVLSYPNAGVKDQALIWFDGRWHMIFSYVTGKDAAPGHEQWDIATATSTDMADWSPPSPWSEQPGGLASPDIVRSPDGRFVVTYDSPPGEQQGHQAKLYFRTSDDLVHWSAPQRLAPASILKPECG